MNHILPVRRLLPFMFCCILLGVPTQGQQLGVQWTTYLGGSGNDYVRDIVVDNNDNVYVCGVFESPDFPKPRNVPTSFDTVGPGGYLASFSPQGELLWLQYFSCFSPTSLAITKNEVLVAAGGSNPKCGLEN
ncbi:MAG: SBBP repeat-containing protein, partial [Candidatus Kapaibacterium sp.]